MNLLFKDIDVLGRSWIDERKGQYTFNSDQNSPVLQDPSPKFCIALIADQFPARTKADDKIANFRGQQVTDFCSVSE